MIIKDYDSFVCTKKDALELLNTWLIGKKFDFGNQILDMTVLIFGEEDEPYGDPVVESIDGHVFQYSIHIQTNFTVLKDEKVLLRRTKRILDYNYDPDYKNFTKKINDLAFKMKSSEIIVADITEEKGYFPVINCSNGYKIKIRIKESDKETWRAFELYSEEDEKDIPNHLVCYGEKIFIE
ncbi:MAG: hypothetical protein IJS45_08295 [Clostridia bacterium]|nr:hypothetical protein [Clostridia bacterium]